MKRTIALLVFSAIVLNVGGCGSDDVRVADPSSSGTSIATLPSLSFSPTNHQALIAYYPFEGNANDESGHGNDGIVVGASFVPGQIGNALAFDGDDYVRIPGVGLLDALPGEAMIIEALIKLDPTAPNRNAICERELAGGDCWPWFLLTFNSRELYGLVRGCTGAVVGPILGLDRWYHVCLVYEVVAGKAIGKLYVDGFLVATNNNMETRNSIGGDIFIGAAMRSDYGSERFQDFFHGIIDEVKIWAGLPVYLDIEPGSCPNPLNVKTQGTVPAAILGTDYFDVSDINVSTILLEGVSPTRSAIEDVATPVADIEDCACTTEGPDGFDDLTLKFKTQEIVAAIGDVQPGDIIVLTITGALLDGTPFEAVDCVRIVGGGNKVERTIM